MKIKQHRDERLNVKKSLIISAVLLLVAGAGIVYWLKIASPKQDSSANGPTPAQQRAVQEVNNDQKKAFAEDTKGVDNPGVTIPPPTSPDTIELSASKTDSSSVTVFTKLKNYAGGTCELTVTSGAKTY